MKNYVFVEKYFLCCLSLLVVYCSMFAMDGIKPNVDEIKKIIDVSLQREEDSVSNFNVFAFLADPQFKIEKMYPFSLEQQLILLNTAHKYEKGMSDRLNSERKELAVLTQKNEEKQSIFTEILSCCKRRHKVPLNKKQRENDIKCLDYNINSLGKTCKIIDEAIKKEHKIGSWEMLPNDDKK